MPKTNPPFRFDHVGSLVRPKKILAAFDAYEDGTIGFDEFSQLQNQNIREVVALQADLGLTCVTDGEFRRRSYNRGFVEAVDGLEQRPTPFKFKTADGTTDVAVKGGFAVRKLRRRRRIIADDFAFLKSVTSLTAKVTMPTPAHYHFGLFRECVDRSVYPDLDVFFADLVEIYRAEIAELGALGCRYLQLDEVSMPMLCDPENRELARRLGEDPDKLIDLYVGLNNAILENRPAGMAIAMHFCRGNRTGMWAAAGDYDPIAERIFRDIDVDAYLLEFDGARSGGFAPLRHLPEGKIALLGLLSTKNPELETPAELKRKLDEAAEFAPIERLGLCPQCGFAASAQRVNAHDNPMTEDIEKRKLRRMVEVGREIWDNA